MSGVLNLAVFLISSGLVLSQASASGQSQQSGQQSSGQPAATGQPTSSSTGSGDAIKLFAISLTWATVVIQLVVVPFYNKGETLHKDYWQSGKINSTVAAIEAGALIPSLARMFNLATSQQKDKRRRPEIEMEELLQSVEFAPDLEKTQEAMSSMDEIKQQYRRLKLQASRLWKVGLVHVFVTPCLPAIYVFLIPLNDRFRWLFWLTVVVWALTLAVSIWGFIRFHWHIGRFNELLEIDLAEDA